MYLNDKANFCLLFLISCYTGVELSTFQVFHPRCSIVKKGNLSKKSNDGTELLPH